MVKLSKRHNKVFVPTNDIQTLIFINHYCFANEGEGNQLLIPFALDYFIYFPRLSMRSGKEAAWKAKNLLHTDKKYNPSVGPLKMWKSAPKCRFLPKIMG